MKQSNSFWNSQIGRNFIQVVSGNFALIYFTVLATFCHLYDLSEKHSLFCTLPRSRVPRKSKHCQISKKFLQSDLRKGKRQQLFFLVFDTFWSSWIKNRFSKYTHSANFLFPKKVRENVAAAKIQETFRENMATPRHR